MAHVIAKQAAEHLNGSTLGYLLSGPFLPIIGAALLLEELAHLVSIPLIPATLIARALSRSRESEASYIGMLLMTEASFHRRGAVTVFRKLNEIDENSKQFTPQRKAPEPGFLSTLYACELKPTDHCLSLLKHNRPGRVSNPAELKVDTRSAQNRWARAGLLDTPHTRNLAKSQLVHWWGEQCSGRKEAKLEGILGQ